MSNDDSTWGNPIVASDSVDIESTIRFGTQNIEDDAKFGTKYDFSTESNIKEQKNE